MITRPEQDVSLSLDGTTLLPLCDLVGYACFVTWTFFIAWYGNPDFIIGGDESLLFVLRLSLFGGVAVMSCALLFFDNVLRTRADRVSSWIFSPFVACLPVSLTFFTELPLVTSLVLWCVAGFGQALCFYLWNKRFCVLSRRQQLIAVCGAFVVAGSSLSFSPYVELVMVRILASVLPAVSVLFMMCARHRFSGTQFPESDRSNGAKSDGGEERQIRRPWKKMLIRQLPDQPERGNIVLKGLFAALYSVFLGFTACLFLSSLFYPVNNVIIGLGNLIAAAFMLLIVRDRERAVCNIPPKLFLPVTSLCYLLIGVFWPSEGILFCVLLLFSLFTCYEIINARTAYVFSICDPTRCFWELRSSKFGSAVGFFVGWLSAMLMPVASADSAVLLVACFLMVSLAAIVDTFFFKEMKFEFREVIINNEPLVEALDSKSIDVVASVRGKFRKACDDLSEEYKLTPRQKEIFLLLAKGRNVHYIKEKLFLSTPTVKSHVYNIYQKMNIHSHQELLDLIEKRSSGNADDTNDEKAASR